MMKERRYVGRGSKLGPKAREIDRRKYHDGLFQSERLRMAESASGSLERRDFDRRFDERRKREGESRRKDYDAHFEVEDRDARNERRDDYGGHFGRRDCGKLFDEGDGEGGSWRKDYDAHFDGVDRDGQLGKDYETKIGRRDYDNGDFERTDYGKRFDEGDRGGRSWREDYHTHFDGGNRDGQLGKDYDSKIERRRDYYHGHLDNERLRRNQYGSVSLERRDYDRCFDEGDRVGGGSCRKDYDTHFVGGNRDGRLQGFSSRIVEESFAGQRDSTSMKFQCNHLVDEPKKSSGDANQHSLMYSGDDYDVGNAENDYITTARVSNDRNYQPSFCLDMDRSGMLLEKPISFEPRDVDVSKSYGRVDDNSLLPLRRLYAGLDPHKDEEDLRLREHLHLGKIAADKTPGRRKLDEDSMTNSKGDFGYVISSSRTKALVPESLRFSKEDPPASLRESPHVLLDGYRLSSGIITKPAGDDGHPQKQHSRSSVGPEVQLSDITNNSQPYLSSTKGTQGDQSYSEVWKSVKDDMGTMSRDFSRKTVKVGEEYGHRDLYKSVLLDPIVDRIENREYMRETRLLLDHHLSSQQQPILDKYAGSRSLHKRKQDEEVSGNKSTNLEYEREVYQNHGSLQSGEVEGYERDGGPWAHEEGSEMLRRSEFDPYLEGLDGRSQQRSARERGVLEPSKKMLKRKFAMENKMSKHNLGRKGIFSGKNALKIHDEGHGEDMGPLVLSKKTRVSHSKYGMAGSTSNETVSHMISNPRNLSVSMPRHVSKSYKPGSRDIKKRLGPGPENVRVSHPLVKKNKVSVKKRLGPGPPKFHRPLPWLNNFDRYKLPRIQDGSDGSVNDQEGDPSEGNNTPTKTEPHENSYDFKHLVQSVFFKFVKMLNENSAQRRRLVEQGKAGSLRCSVCGSNSEEFVDTESLVMHACTSPMVGFRSQHLGFHKALCALMGWKCAVASNTPWVREMMSDTETIGLKEDLIIWPPVVIIHNCSIRIDAPDERVVVSSEVLEAILRDMGFGEKMSVCHGKSADQSMKVVKFNSTFSGLQDAGRLHKFYAENKHGRTEIQQIHDTNCSSSSGENQTLVDKMKHVLYGYLGIAEDLDKLDFKTKKRCVVKSRKEIQDIADASVKT